MFSFTTADLIEIADEAGAMKVYTDLSDGMMDIRVIHDEIGFLIDARECVYKNATDEIGKVYYDVILSQPVDIVDAWSLVGHALYHIEMGKVTHDTEELQYEIAARTVLSRRQ